MIAVIRVTLKNSAMHESPETITRIVKDRVDAAISGDPMLGLFVADYTVEVVP